MARAVSKIDIAGERLSGAALEAFSRIAGLWKLSASEQRALLGSIPESTYFKYLKNPRTDLARARHLQVAQRVAAAAGVRGYVDPSPQQCAALQRAHRIGLYAQRAV